MGYPNIDVLSRPILRPFHTFAHMCTFFFQTSAVLLLFFLIFCTPMFFSFNLWFYRILLIGPTFQYVNDALGWPST